MAALRHAPGKEPHVRARVEDHGRAPLRANPTTATGRNTHGPKGRATTLSDIDDQIEQLKAKRRHMLQEGRFVAKIAAPAGLADVDISDNEAWRSDLASRATGAEPGRTDEPPARLTPSMRDPVHVATLEWSPCPPPP